MRVCVSVCMAVCRRAYLRNYTFDLYQIFLHLLMAQSSSGGITILGFMDDIVCAHNWPYGGMSVLLLLDIIVLYTMPLLRRIGCIVF